MSNTYTRNECGRILRLIWFVTDGPVPELRSLWSVQADSDDVVSRNRPVTDTCETEPIATCA